MGPPLRASKAISTSAGAGTGELIEVGKLIVFITPGAVVVQIALGEAIDHFRITAHQGAEAPGSV